jgi:hypothetical protein
MGRIYKEINEQLNTFIRRQHVFFVATAPLSGNGHLNLSPKGLDSFRILGPTTVAYLDLVGSGIETVAHVRENGRMTIMFCAFEDHPLIVRLYGRGKIVEPSDAEWNDVAGNFPEYVGARSIVVMHVERVADSCGFGVPAYEYRGERSELVAYAEKQGQVALERYKAEKNAQSIDGLAGLRSSAPAEDARRG